MHNFQLSREILNKPYEEFNNQSLVELQNECQKLFNNWKDAKSEDADENWRSNAVRPITRNRAISIAAHVTGMVIYPNVLAQNENQEEDKEAGVVMKEFMEWVNDQCEYPKTFLSAVIAALVNPATVIHTEYCQNWRTIKEIQEDGKWKEKKVLDDILSGFKDTMVPLDEFFIADIYEPDVQKQPYLIWRRVIDYRVANQKYRDRENWKYVKPGMQTIFDDETNTFYEQFDEELRQNLVEEVVFFDRFQDLQLTFVNGVLQDDPDQPIKRQDKMYPFVKGGYEPLDEGRFFYYFSLVRKMKDDAEIINEVYRDFIDGGKLRNMPPTAVFGDEIINGSVIAPRKISQFAETTKLEAINVGGSTGEAESMLNRLEASVSESSSDVLQSGQSIRGSQTAFEISRLEQNAKIMLGLFGKMIGFMVKDLGQLRLSDITQFMTVGDVDEIVGDSLKYKSVLLPNKTDGGKAKTHRIIQGNFDLPTDEMERSRMTMALQGGMPMDMIGQVAPEGMSQYVNKGFKSDQKIYLVNPAIFRSLKYRVIIEPDMLAQPSDNLRKALNLELFDRAIQLPFANQENLARDLLFGSYEQTKSDVDKYITKLPPQPQPMSGAQPSVLRKLFGSGDRQAMNSSTQQLNAETLQR